MSIDAAALEPKIVAKGKEFFQSIAGEAPSIFNKSWWTGKVMDWAMKNEDFKVQMFRFVDVLPYLTTSESLSRHIAEYFGDKDANIPDVLKWGAGKTGIGGGLVAKMLNKAISSNIEGMGRQFIIGENAAQAMKGIRQLRKDGFGFIIDLLGEEPLGEKECDDYLAGYMEILDAIGAECAKWKPLGGAAGALDWGTAPKVNVAIKPSCFDSQAKPVDLEGSIERIYKRVNPIYRKIKAMGGFMCIDVEQIHYREMTIELYKRLRSDPEHRDYPYLGIVFQAYIKRTESDVAAMIDWARKEKLPISIRLVKGAYWDYETVLAKQNGWEIPVWTVKPETDAAHERIARMILQNSDICHFACASHNIRTISNVIETAKALNVPEDRYEFQVLYGMAEPVRKGLLKVAKRVRLYCPYGDLIPGMAYLVRRLLENTANESFLRQSFAEGAELERLLENPIKTAERERAAKKAPAAPKLGPGGIPPFGNQPVIDFTIPAMRAGMKNALAAVRGELGKTYPLVIGGKEVTTTDVLDSYNPAKPEEIIGHVCQAGLPELDQAVKAARAAYLVWRDVPPAERSKVLFRAADVMRRDIFKLSALQVLEVGKQWGQAYADIGEAIDFLEYYGREMIRLGSPRRMGTAPGELNHYFYQGKGVAAVIGPWNFPMAISTGMASAAIVCGDSVVYKPSGLSAVTGAMLARVFKEAGLPDGVFTYLPGRGSVMGDALVEHPDVSVIAFTGSMEVGLRIQEKAARVQPGQPQCKKVIAEMGGKNAIIVDDDADLDQAVSGALYSAFGYQGQKCSACSRVIVLDAIYDRFVSRFTEAAKSIPIGPAEDPANGMGPVVDRAAQKNILKYVDIACSEGKVLVKRDDIPAEGCYAPLTIVEGVTKDMRIAQEEVFGPVLAIMRAKNMDEALDIANSTRFALTGSIYSRSPKHLERARKEFRVGNLYLNKGSTGALVGRQSFGGFNMSGVGSKSGGPDYLLQFMDPRVICENTMRRGFAPAEEGDDVIE